MRTNTTLSLLRDQKVAFGTWLQLHSFQGSRMLAAQGFFDWLLLDFEHTPVDRSSAAQILSTIADVSGGRVTPLARVSTSSVDQIKHALDAGAQGIIVPMIKDADEVRAGSAIRAISTRRRARRRRSVPTPRLRCFTASLHPMRKQGDPLRRSDRDASRPLKTYMTFSM